MMTAPIIYDKWPVYTMYMMYMYLYLEEVVDAISQGHKNLYKNIFRLTAQVASGVIP